METCVQCGKQEEKFSVVAIMNFEPEAAMKSVAANKDRTFMAMGICTVCHNAPTIKAHFFYRPQMQQALDRAGSSSIG